jgi:hypothetical protein
MKSGQKIGFFVDGSGQDFPWLPLTEVATHFRKKGYQILGFAFNDTGKHKKFKKVFDDFFPINETSEDYDFNIAVGLSKQLKKEKLRLMFFANYQYTSMLVTAKYLTKGKLRLIYLQDRPFNEINRDRFHSLRSNQLDLWVTPNSHALQEVRAGANIEFSKLHMIERPLRAPSKIISVKNPKRIRREHGIDENAITIGLFLNQSIEVGKDLQRLLQIVSQDPILRTQVVFLIGTNETSEFRNDLKAAILKAAQQVGLADNLFYFGKRKLVFAEDGADVMFLLTNEEPFSGAAALAKLHGIPCLGFKSGMLTEVLRDYPFQSLNSLEQKSELGFELELLKKMRHYGMTKFEIHSSKRKRKEYLSNLEALAEALPKRRKTLF